MRKLSGFSLLIVLVSLALAGCGAAEPQVALADPLTIEAFTAEPPTLAPVPVCQGKFTFAMQSGQAADLYMADACQGQAIRTEQAARIGSWVACDPASAANVAWSPDGARLAYITDPNYTGMSEVVVVDVASGASRVLAPAHALVDSATGAVIKQDCHCDLNGCVVDPDTQCQPANLVNGKVMFLSSRRPVWSPDGTQIVFESLYFTTDAEGRYPVQAYAYFAVNADGSSIVRLADEEGQALATSWQGQTYLDSTLAPAFNYEVAFPYNNVSCIQWHP